MVAVYVCVLSVVFCVLCNVCGLFVVECEMLYGLCCGVVVFCMCDCGVCVVAYVFV